MERISDSLAEIMNLCNAAKWHREHCRECPNKTDCNVSLWQLGMTAKRLVKHCWLSELRRAERIIRETDWT